MKKYVYKKDRFFVNVTLVGIFCLLLGIYNSYSFIENPNILNLFITIVCIYQIFNTFFSLSNPEEVHISDERISFKAYGQVHSYDFKQIEDFRVREFPQAKKVYVRINKNKNSLFKGRYWLFCYYFNDAEELYQWFLDREYQTHPDTIKASNRRTRQSASEEKKQNQFKTEKDKKGGKQNGCL